MSSLYTARLTRIHPLYVIVHLQFFVACNNQIVYLKRVTFYEAVKCFVRRNLLELLDYYENVRHFFLFQTYFLHVKITRTRLILQTQNVSSVLVNASYDSASLSRDIKISVRYVSFIFAIYKLAVFHGCHRE
jgi:hypothetical protein